MLRPEAVDQREAPGFEPDMAAKANGVGAGLARHNAVEPLAQRTVGAAKQARVDDEGVFAGAGRSGRKSDRDRHSRRAGLVAISGRWSRPLFTPPTSEMPSGVRKQ